MRVDFDWIVLLPRGLRLLGSGLVFIFGNVVMIKTVMFLNDLLCSGVKVVLSCIGRGDLAFGFAHGILFDLNGVNPRIGSSLS